MKTNPDIRIREALPSDAPALAQFIADYCAEHGGQLDQSSVTVDIERLLGICESELTHTVLLAEHLNALLGYTVVHWSPFLLFRGTEGYISELFVLATNRGCGIGSQLLAHVESEARDRGCFRLILNNFREQESYKREFYPKLGFVERGEVGNFVKPLDKKPEGKPNQSSDPT